MRKFLRCALACSLFFTSASAQGLKWAKSFGGSGIDGGHVIAVDDTGNVYTSGTFTGTVDFDPGAGTTNLTATTGGKSIFVQKLDSSGNFVWAVSMGSPSPENRPNSIKLDKLNNIIITGRFQGAVDFDPGAGLVNLANYGIANCFTLKLDNAGQYIWAKGIQGIAGDLGCASAVDDSCNVFVVGDFFGVTDVDPGAGTLNFNSAGFWDIFIIKLDSSGAFKWGRQIGSGNSERCYAVTTDTAGNMYACGQYTDMVDFDPGPGVSTLPGGNINPFILKLDGNGQYIWAKGTSGILGDGAARNLALDRLGNVYTIGNFFGVIDFDTDGATLNFNGGPATSPDNFILKHNNNGDFAWAAQIKSEGANTNSFSLAIDTAFNVYTVGTFSDSIDVNPALPQEFLTTGETDTTGYILKLSGGGGHIWSRAIQNVGPNGMMGVAADKRGYVYTTGNFSGTADFDFTAPVFSMSSMGQRDVFIQKLTADTIPTATVNILPVSNELSIYPNPSGGPVYVVSQENIDKLEITDVVGKRVYMAKPGKKEATFIMETPGIYFITVSSAEKVQTEKLVVQ